MVVLTQVHDLAHHIGMGRERTEVRPAGTVAQPVEALGFVAALPRVKALPANPVVTAGLSDVAGNFLGVLEDGQATLGLTYELLFGHLISFA